MLQLFYTLYCEDAFRENQFQYKATTASSIKEIIFLWFDAFKNENYF